MSDQAAIGHGSKFLRSDDGTSTGTLVAVSGVMNIGPPSLSKDMIDATDMDSTDRWREFIAGLKDGGQVTIEHEFVPGGADVTNWLADANSNTVGYYAIDFPDVTRWAFTAHLESLEFDVPLDDKMTATATYKLTGKPAFIT